MDKLKKEAVNHRTYLPKDFMVKSWIGLKPIYDELKERSINNVEALKKWLRDCSELQTAVSEDLGWRYIKMNIDTTDDAAAQEFQYFIEEIQPHIAPYENILHKKVINCSYIKDLKEDGYKVFLREVKKDIELYRQENIYLETELDTLGQKYGAISAGLSVEVDGKELTLQQAAKFLKNTDRKKREEVYKKVNDRRLDEKSELNLLFSELIEKRQKVAQNAGFSNYRDYMFKAMGRFDYTKDDCFNFHNAIAQEIVPINNQINTARKKQLGYEQLRPWDTSVDVTGKEPLTPFKDVEDLVEETKKCFSALRPYFGECITKMQLLHHLDLDSKKGKAPGGFNYPLNETGAPFIFMNAAGTFRDMVTLLHEGGHAVHAFLCNDLELNVFKNVPSEVAELASMSMELLTMEHWDIFFDNEEDLKRAKKEQLEQILNTLPWIATIDKFQHKLYERPNHTVEERNEMWRNSYKYFKGDVVDWTGLSEYYDNVWQKQLHLFEVPFYYIEYGFAQLGAIAIWRNYKENSEKALDDYIKALSLGYTKPIGEIYKTAGIRFDFSPKYVRELAQFIKEQVEELA